jgi:uncharacterized protein
MAEGLTIALPLVFSDDDGPYLTIKEMEDLATQHLKMIVLTSPGERVMDPDFGVGIRNYLFEQETPLLTNEVRSNIKKQVDRYSPFIKIIKINTSIDSDSGLMSLEIMYAVPSSNIVSNFTIPIS